VAAPAVTIVIPVFGTEQYLAACLESVLNQTFDDFEVIVVDDCSPGDVAGIVAATAGEDTRVRLVRHEVNRGLLQARFTGGHEATGAYIGFVDSDDEVEDFFLMQLYMAAVQHDADLVDCPFVMVDKEVLVVNRGGEEHVLSGSEILRGVLTRSMSNSLWSKLTRLSTWRKATAPLEQIRQRVGLIEDLLCLVYVAVESERFAHTSRPCYRYLVREGSMTTAGDLDSLLRNFDSLDAAYSVIRSTLDDRPLPRGLADEFFTREFVSVGRQLLLDMADLLPDTPQGLPRSAETLGLLGAVAVLCTTAGTG
jgi:hypothetical protein